MQTGTTTDVGTIAAYVRKHRRDDDSRVRPPFIFVGAGVSAMNLRARVIDRAGDFSCLTCADVYPDAVKHATLVVAVEGPRLTVVKAC